MKKYSDKKVLNMFSKAELVDIILDSEGKHSGIMFAVRRRAIEKCAAKVNAIIDEQEKCDFATTEGKLKYLALKKEYKEADKILSCL